MAIIEFENTGFSYRNGVRALDAVNLSIEAGEYVAIIGGNGSGKSTLARHIDALLTPDEGSVRVFGLDTRDDANTIVIRSQIGMVFQNPDDQIVASLVEDDVAFGPENLGIPPDEIRERVTSALAQVHLEGFELRDASTLSGGEKQRLAIVGALAMQPDVIVFDEADSMLDTPGRESFSALCRQLHDKGIAIILITHSLEQARQADRVIVLDHGRIVADGAPFKILSGKLPSDLSANFWNSRPVRDNKRHDTVSETSFTPSQRATENTIPSDHPATVSAFGSGRGLAACADGQENTGTLKLSRRAAVGETPPGAERRDRQKILQLENIWFQYENTDEWVLKDYSLTIPRGEILGITGNNGTGKSTLIQLMGGILQPKRGRVLANSLDLNKRNSRQEARNQIGIVMQFPERQLFAATVFDDVAFGPSNANLAAGEIEARVQAALEIVGLEAADLAERSPFALSEGQQRRVALAGVLSMQPNLLILDEPTVGLDPRGRGELLALLADLNERQGLTIALTTHDIEVAQSICTRIERLERSAYSKS